jgi:serine/threonine-protein kinase RsbW
MSQPEVRVTIPAQSRFISLIRVTAAGIAAELDFTVDEIEEWKVGADELISMLIEAAEDHDVGEVELRFEIGDDTVTMHGHVDVESADLDSSLDALTRQILEAVVDTYSIAANAGYITKRRAPA